MRFFFSNFVRFLLPSLLLTETNNCWRTVNAIAFNSTITRWHYRFKWHYNFLFNPLSQFFYFRFSFDCSFRCSRVDITIKFIVSSYSPTLRTKFASHINANSANASYSIDRPNTSTIRTEFKNRSMLLIAAYCSLSSSVFASIGMEYTMRSILVLYSRFVSTHSLIQTFIRNCCFRWIFVVLSCDSYTSRLCITHTLCICCESFFRYCLSLFSFFSHSSHSLMWCVKALRVLQHAALILNIFDSQFRTNCYARNINRSHSVLHGMCIVFGTFFSLFSTVILIVRFI